MSDFLSIGVCKLFDYFDDSTSHYLVFEYLDGIDLFQLMENRDFNPLGEAEALFILRSVAPILNGVHKLNVGHLDIKLENIFVTQESIKVIDFGLSSLTLRKCEQFCGSLDYSAPEVLHRQAYDASKADVYSLVRICRINFSYLRNLGNCTICFIMWLFSIYV